MVNILKNYYNQVIWTILTILVDIKGRNRCTWEEVQLLQLITAEGSTDNSRGAETKSKAVRQKETNPSIKLPSNFYRYADLFNWIFLNNLNVQNVPRTKRSKYTWPLHGNWTQEKHDVFKRKVFTKVVVVFNKKPMAPISIYVFSLTAVSVWWWNTKTEHRCSKFAYFWQLTPFVVLSLARCALQGWDNAWPLGQTGPWLVFGAGGGLAKSASLDDNSNWVPSQVPQCNPLATGSSSQLENLTTECPTNEHFGEKFSVSFSYKIYQNLSILCSWLYHIY